ncbi:hypothetical protein FACS1894219_01980 [Clostridia bacterium]|nr:hypothetical protein FACS1894219_01980 [Clostridia bacterium]
MKSKTTARKLSLILASAIILSAVLISLSGCADEDTNGQVFADSTSVTTRASANSDKNSDDIYDDSYDDSYDDDYDYDDDDSYNDKSVKKTISRSIATFDPSDTWAIYWYLCGSDLETDDGFASTDLDELSAIELPENIKVVIETGGANTWHDYGDPNYNTRFLYDSDGWQTLQENPRANMGDSKTLESFLRFCNTNYPADHKAVIFWDHGGGSTSGVAFDELFSMDSLNLIEIYDAFNAVNDLSKDEPPYEMVGFDACLMATIEVAGTLNGIANWLVASEELEPGLGWNYTGLMWELVQNPGMNGGQWGEAICDAYYSACEDAGCEDDVTLSVIEMSKIDMLLEAYENIGAESLITACDDVSYISSFGRAAKNATNFGGNNESEGYTNMVDLGDLVRQAGEELLPQFGGLLLAALDRCVYYQVRGAYRSEATGLSCFYSYDGDYEVYDKFSYMIDENPYLWYYDYVLTGELSQEGWDYASSIYTRYSQTPEEEMSPQSVPSLKDMVDVDFPVTFFSRRAVLGVGTDIANMLTGVYCNLAYYDVENDIAIFLGRDNDLLQDWENGIFMDNFRGVWGSIDGSLVYMELTDEAETYQIYTVPVMLNGEKYSLSVSYDLELNKYRILGARRGIDENGMADKNLRKLKPGDVIEPLVYYFQDDEDMKQITVDTVTVTADTVFEDTDMGDGTFMYMFEMVDAQNKSYYSEVVLFSVEDGEISLLKE